MSPDDPCHFGEQGILADGLNALRWSNDMIFNQWYCQVDMTESALELGEIIYSHHRMVCLLELGILSCLDLTAPVSKLGEEASKPDWLTWRIKLCWSKLAFDWRSCQIILITNFQSSPAKWTVRVSDAYEVMRETMFSMILLFWTASSLKWNQICHINLSFSRISWILSILILIAMSPRYGRILTHNHMILDKF